MAIIRKYIIYILVIGVYACKKDNPPSPDPDNDTLTAEEAIIAKSTFLSIFSISDAFIRSEESPAYQLSYSCPKITATSSNGNNYLESILLDFTSDSGCSALDGKNRSGLLEISLNGKYDDSGTVIDINPKNYVIDGYEVEGIITITQKSTNDSSNFSMTIRSGTISNGDKTIEWSSNWNLTQQNGCSSIDPLDDIYLISGNSIGKSSTETDFKAKITQSLTYTFNCKWLREGILRVTEGNQNDRIIDFGNGSCDQNATISVGSLTIPISIL